MHAATSKRDNVIDVPLLSTVYHLVADPTDAFRVREHDSRIDAFDESVGFSCTTYVPLSDSLAWVCFVFIPHPAQHRTLVLLIVFTVPGIDRVSIV